jgi:hypothetical protein
MYTLKKIIKRYFGFVLAAKYIGSVVKRPFVLFDFINYRKQMGHDKAKPLLKDFFPFTKDKTTITPFEPHYIYHPAWAARIIKEFNPSKHIDISSTLHFCTLLSTFIPTEFYDYRPANVKLSNLRTGSADLCSLHFDDNSIESLSCMHTIEHIGLGRYGDPIDPHGDRKAINELQRVLKVGGNLLFVTPVGKPRIQFNAHRIYSYENIISLFSQLTLKEFSLIPDNGVDVGIIKNADPKLVELQYYGCGCFWFTK